MTARLTRRGWGVVGVIVAGLSMALAFEPRSLAAVVVPALLALVVGTGDVLRTERPTLERRVTETATVGNREEVTIRLRADKPIVCAVYDAVSGRISASGNEATLATAEATLEYDLECFGRGEATVGPATVTVTDALGLVSRQYEYDTDSLLVYPPTERLPIAIRRWLTESAESQDRAGRGEFDRLRGYTRGDPLRDVHWKSSAKRSGGELVVREFTAETTGDSVTVAVDAGETMADADAAARVAAGVVSYGLDVGSEVGLAIPGRTIEPESGSEHRAVVLGALARMGPGLPSEDGRADVRVVASDGTATVRTMATGGAAGGREVVA